jgi:hypothetical protein
MSKVMKSVLAPALCLAACLCLAAEPQTVPEEKTLSVIASGIDGYRDKNITLTLKLKNLDRIFGFITFYDNNNHDISFDISSSESRKRFAGELLNIHEGMNYRVTFTVRGVGGLGLLLGDLQGFEPLILEIIPEVK